MRFAILLESQEGLTWPHVLAVAERAEAVGLDGLYLSDHFAPVDASSGREVLPAWPVVAVLADRTSRIRLGTLVSPITFRHPVDLCKQVVALEHLAGPRIDLGLGAAWHEAEHRLFGFDFPAPSVRVDRLGEALAVVADLWTGDPVERTGEHFTVAGGSLIPRPLSSVPPLVLGGSRPRMLHLAAQYAKEWNCFYTGIADYVGLRDAFESACTSVGRDSSSVRRSLMTPLLVGRTTAEVDGRLAANRRVFASLPADREAWRASGFPGGTVAELTEQVQAWSALGVERIIFEHNDPTDLDALELLAEIQSSLA